MTIKSSTVLVVDDIETNRDILKRRLEYLDFSVTTAEVGMEALAMLADKNFDIVLLDIMMPDFSGIETLREIRANPLWQYLPVIMVRAKDETDTLPKCLEIGANDYVSKPVNISILIARMHSQLSRKWTMDEIAQTQIILEERVEERTDELQTSIKNLKQGVIERDQAKSESKRAKMQLMDAIGSLSDGFALFDADNRLQLINDKFYEMYELSPEQTLIGSSYEEILRKVAEKHVITEAFGREDPWIRKQLNIIDKESEESTANGRWIRIGQRKTTEGGLVGIYSDITTQMAEIARISDTESRWCGVSL
jgi:DNA-binding response OmpR family regulator